MAEKTREVSLLGGKQDHDIQHPGGLSSIHSEVTDSVIFRNQNKAILDTM